MRDYAAVVVWGGVAIGAILAATAFVWAVRKRLRSPVSIGAGPVFTLQDLRDMRERGDLSDVEFTRMRTLLLGAAASRADAAAGGGRQGRNDDSP